MAAYLYSCCFSCFPQMVYADVMQEPETEAAGIEASDTASEEETVLLEGIRLNTTSLIMKTGEQKTLMATLLPENTTEQPEILWSSTDPDVVQVAGDGTTAVVTAPEGEGGTAVITVTAGDYTASCRVLVTVQEPMLESMIFMQNSSGSNRYELTEAEEGVREYTLRVPESTNVVYVRPQLRDDVQDAQITAKFTDITSGEEVSVDLPTDEVTSLTSSAGRLLKAYNIQPVELTLEVTEGSYTEVHKIHVVRGTYLGSLQITDDEGGEVAYTPTFKKQCMNIRCMCRPAGNIYRCSSKVQKNQHGSYRKRRTGRAGQLYLTSDRGNHEGGYAGG